MADKKKGKDNETGGKDEKQRSALTRAQRSAKANEGRKQTANAQSGGGLKGYFKGVKIETKKVVWPTRKELVSYTIVVIITCAFFALLTWGVDSAFLAGLREVLGISM